MPDMNVAATSAGRTPAVHYQAMSISSETDREPLARTGRLVQGTGKCTCGHAPHCVMLATYVVYRRVDSIIDERCVSGRMSRNKKLSTVIEDAPRTPAELPTKVPRRVTEFKMALIRSLAFDTASGFRAPSRSPQSPPRARPARTEVNM